MPRRRISIVTVAALIRGWAYVTDALHSIYANTTARRLGRQSTGYADRCANSPEPPGNSATAANKVDTAITRAERARWRSLNQPPVEGESNVRTEDGTRECDNADWLKVF